MAGNQKLVTRTVENAEKAITEILFDEPTQPMTVFDILGVSKPALFMALYNAAPVLDRHYSNDINISTARSIIEGYTSCGLYTPGLTDFTAAGNGESRSCRGYGRVSSTGMFMGRHMDIDLSGDEMHTAGYDRGNGEGAAFRATKTVLAALAHGMITPALERGDD